jgi:hypothetical protein
MKRYRDQREFEQLRSPTFFSQQLPLVLHRYHSPLFLSLSPLLSYIIIPRYHSAQRSALAGKSAAAIKETTRAPRKEKAEPRYLLTIAGDKSKASRFLLVLIALLVLLFP